MSSAIQIIQGKLYFAVVDDSQPAPQSNAQHSYFCTDSTLVYTAFFADFGPLNLGLAYSFCEQLREHLSNAERLNKAVIYYCANHPHRRSNAAVLLLSYLIFVLGYSAEDAYRPFLGIKPPFIPFRDAAFCINTYPVTVLDCACAMYRAVVMKHFDYRTFSLNEFQRLSKLEYGDISWIVPGKFIAFSGPLAKRREISPGVYTLTPGEYVPIFKRLGVTCIVRFNSKCYDRNIFTSSGIRHVDLYYEDGGNPTEAILQAFISLSENEKGAIAVHCKAGLGRTGTNIAAFMIKHYGYSTAEATAWCRICRPGSVVGPQQQYLMTVEERLKLEGDAFREKHKISVMPLSSAPTGNSVQKSLLDQFGTTNGKPLPLSTDSSNSSRCSTPPISGPGSENGTRPSQGRSAAASSLFRSVQSTNTSQALTAVGTSAMQQATSPAKMAQTASPIVSVPARPSTTAVNLSSAIRSQFHKTNDTSYGDKGSGVAVTKSSAFVRSRPNSASERQALAAASSSGTGAKGLMVRISNDSLQSALAKASISDHNNEAGLRYSGQAAGSSSGSRQQAMTVAVPPPRPVPSNSAGHQSGLATSPIAYGRPKTSSFGQF